MFWWAVAYAVPPHRLAWSALAAVVATTLAVTGWSGWRYALRRRPGRITTAAQDPYTIIEELTAG